MDEKAKEMEKLKQLVAEAVSDVMTDDPDCPCERCEARRDWCRRAQEGADKDGGAR